MSSRIPRLPRRPRIPTRRRTSGRRGSGWLLALLGGVLVAVLIAGVVWFALGPPDDTVEMDPQQGIDALRDDLEAEIAARQAAEEALRRAEQQLEIKTAEVAAFSGDIERQEAELLELRDDLAFYQRLAEGSGEDGLGIRSLQLQRTGQSGVFDVLFQLYRPGLNRSVDVEWTLEVEGYREGEEETTTLDAEALELDGDRTVQGLRLLRNHRVRIQLPEGFEPRRLTLSVSAEDDDDLEPVSEGAGWDRLLEGVQ